LPLQTRAEPAFLYDLRFPKWGDAYVRGLPEYNQKRLAAKHAAAAAVAAAGVAVKAAGRAKRSSAAAAAAPAAKTKETIRAVADVTESFAGELARLTAAKAAAVAAREFQEARRLNALLHSLKARIAAEVEAAAAAAEASCVPVPEVDEPEPSTRIMEPYHPWSKNWRIVEKNTDRTGLCTTVLYDPKTGDLQGIVEGKEESRLAALCALRAAFSVRRHIAKWEAAVQARAVKAAMHYFEKVALRELADEIERARMRNIQRRVMALMEERSIPCTLIDIDLIHRKIDLHEEVQFVPGKAEIKLSSYPLMKQIVGAFSCIHQTCDEFGEPQIDWGVDGHTALSDKDDSGMGTSLQRARAVCQFIDKAGIPAKNLHPKGHGCFIKPAEGKDPRRVELRMLSWDDLGHYPSYAQLLHDNHGLERLRTALRCTHFQQRRPSMIAGVEAAVKKKNAKK
jgi:outer membrane protein OmpA-like peptidoglycan-associated protein